MNKFATTKPRAEWCKPSPRAVTVGIAIVTKTSRGVAKMENKRHRFSLTPDGVLVHRMHTRSRYLVPWKQVRLLAQRELELFA